VSLAGRHRHGDADDGFTVIELAVAMVIFGVLVGLTSTGWGRYQASQEAVSASSEVVSVMRNAQMRATAEATTYRVDVDLAGRTLTVLRFDGAAYQQRSVDQLAGSRLSLDSASFLDATGTATASAYFYPRGTASPGQVVLRRTGDETPHVITLVGLTGRVSTT
jgi:prepilin-type N-terminal cleavage/methylation domain-containing protein